MGFVRFLREHLTPFGLVIGALMTAYGFIDDAYNLYSLGLQAWVWQVIGVVVIVASLLVFVHRNKVASDTLQLAAQFAGARPSQEPEIDEVSRLGVVISAVRQTELGVRLALASGDEKRMRDTLPALNATFITLSKAYDFPMLKVEDGAPLLRKLDAGRRYLGDALPYLKQGHIEEARAVVEKLVPMLEAYISEGL